MEVYRTEEEQLEAIKRWWKDNGNGILIGIGIAIALVFGWQSWQQNTRSKGEAASVLYTQMQEASRALATMPPVAPVKEGEKPAENPQRATLEHLSKQLKEEYPGTTYSVMAALLMARDKVDSGNAAEAEAELRWALEQKPSAEIMLIINLRLARVLAMKGEPDNAIKLLESVDAGAQKPAYEELKGDIHLAKGDKDKARAAYQAGLDAATETSNNRSLLKTKLDDLAVAE